MSGLPDGTPGYWMHETSGVLRPAVPRKSPRAISLAYLLGQPMLPGHISAMRAYLRQWPDAEHTRKDLRACQSRANRRGDFAGIEAPAWQGSDVDELRAGIDGLTTREAIKAWLDLADEAGIDPL